MTPEKLLETKLTKAVKQAKGRCYKLPAQWYRGIPDRLVLLPGGRIFFVELKTKRGKASEHQKLFQKDLFTLGFFSVIVTDHDHLERFINEHIYCRD
jgi:hypothetical protein